MTAIGDIIPAPFRKSGGSFGLQYPYIMAHDLRHWVIWNRNDGYVVYVSASSDPPAESYTNDLCHRLNGLGPYAGSGSGRDALNGG